MTLTNQSQHCTHSYTIVQPHYWFVCSKTILLVCLQQVQCTVLIQWSSMQTKYADCNFNVVFTLKLLLIRFQLMLYLTAIIMLYDIHRTCSWQTFDNTQFFILFTPTRFYHSYSHIIELLSRSFVELFWSLSAHHAVILVCIFYWNIKQWFDSLSNYWNTFPMIKVATFIHLILDTVITSIINKCAVLYSYVQ